VAELKHNIWNSVAAHQEFLESEGIEHVVRPWQPRAERMGLHHEARSAAQMHFLAKDPHVALDEFE
jgi:hypothetical protein